MNSSCVIPTFYMLENQIVEIVFLNGTQFVQLFGFHGFKKWFRDGIIPAITFPWHTLLDVIFSQNCAKLITHILNTLIRVKHQAVWRWYSASVDGLFESLYNCRLSLQGSADRPPNFCSVCQIQYYRQIALSFVSGNVCDIAYPHRIHFFDIKFTVQQVGRYLQSMLGICCVNKLGPGVLPLKTRYQN